MANSNVPGPLNPPNGVAANAARTPGSMGIQDHGDPNVTTSLGDTPGPTGIQDHGDPSLPKFAAGPGGGAGTAAQTAKGKPIAVGHHPSGNAAKPVLTISGNVVAGPELTPATITAVNAAAAKTPKQWRRYIAYATEVKVGGSLAWRANNPGNLRDASSKIGSVKGAVGNFAVFATMDDGRAAQRSLYLNKYGDMKVSAAINKLTPPNENNTEHYLAQLKKAGVDLDKDVKSQIDVLMPAVEANEGLIAGTVVARLP